MSYLILAVVLLLAPLLARPLGAQTPEAVAQAAETITAATLTRELAGLAADSLRPRRTPSAALERAAQAVAVRFQALGLRPAATAPLGDNTNWIQRYPVPGQLVRLDPAESRLFFTHAPQRAGRNVVTETGWPVYKQLIVPFTTAARWATPWMPDPLNYRWKDEELPVVLLTGRPTVAFLQQADLADKVALYLPPADLDSAGRQAVFEQLSARSGGAILLVDADSSRWANQPAAAVPLANGYLQNQNPLMGAVSDANPRHWRIVVSTADPAVRNVLAFFDVDEAAARTARAPALRTLAGWSMASFILTLAKADTVATAPNVVGILPGQDSTTRGCLVVTAPLDQRGAAPEGDSLAAATAGSTSLAGLLALAETFSRLTVRPRYPVVFLAASGGGAGQALWGSAYYAFIGSTCHPISTLALGLDAGGPARRDTVAFAGLSDVELAQPLTWVARRHPELGLTVVDGGSVFEASSDAMAFAQKFHPSLSVQGSADTGSAAALDWMARLLRLVFYVSHELVTAEKLPQWNTSVRQHLLQQP